MQHPDDNQPRKLGQGRAAEVFLARDEHGRAVVRKVFGGEGVANCVLYLLTGAGNAYAWCESAIRSAFARRRILAHLVKYWFGDRLRLPRTTGWRWNREHLAYELECELIEGSHAPLRGPGDLPPVPLRGNPSVPLRGNPSVPLRGNRPADDPVRELVHEVMKPLQHHLEASGFDGLVWQAGRGNPVAASNFMLERPSGSATGAASWVWIDLESGVPALFALDPLATARFYLPKSLYYRRWLFDDVDVAKLRRYLWRHRRHLESTLGAEALGEMSRQVDELERYQGHWKSMPRHRRSISQELVRGRITARQAETYRMRPLRWQARLAVVGAARGAVRLTGLIRRQLARLARVKYIRLAARAWRFSISQRYRERLARAFVAARMRRWVDRGFLDHTEIARLRRQLDHDETSAYLTDFVVHLMIKAPIKAGQWLFIPPALALGWLDVTTAAFLLVAGGFIGRTLYTCVRVIQAFVRGRSRPWVALITGLLPIVGNAAYPAQLLYGSTERNGDLARFILYDTLAAVGRSVPIWGGADSLTEHFCNRLGDVAVHWLRHTASADHGETDSAAELDHTIAA